MLCTFLLNIWAMDHGKKEAPSIFWHHHIFPWRINGLVHLKITPFAKENHVKYSNQPSSYGVPAVNFQILAKLKPYEAKIYVSS